MPAPMFLQEAERQNAIPTPALSEGVLWPEAFLNGIVAIGKTDLRPPPPLTRADEVAGSTRRGSEDAARGDGG